jgi:hypothetical protein
MCVLVLSLVECLIEWSFERLHRRKKNLIFKEGLTISCPAAIELWFALQIKHSCIYTVFLKRADRQKHVGLFK